jgi:hypothetical protein
LPHAAAPFRFHVVAVETKKFDTRAQTTARGSLKEDVMSFRNQLSTWMFLLPFVAFAALPRIPFSGAFGATDGAGAVVGWERQGLGINPAAGDPNTMGVSFSGYSPFGIEDIKVTEASASWDAAHWGASLAYRGMFSSEVGSAYAWEAQSSVRPGWGIAAGLSGQYQNDEDVSTFGGGAGLLWSRFSFLTLGGKAEILTSERGDEFKSGCGGDVGGNFAEGYGLRLSAEGYYSTLDPLELRFGALLRLHSLLSVYSGWTPQAQTVALGIRFGMGNWEGFSALRRHAVLGTTPVQGLRWRRKIGS